MPLYEYTCAECNRPFEVLVRAVAQGEATVCQHCHSPRVRRLVSGFAAPRGASASSAAPVQGGGGGGCACGGGGCGCGGH